LIDQDRVRIMTRMAIREKRTGYRIQTADGLDRKSFVSYYGVRSFFFGSILYFLVFSIVSAAVFSWFVIPVRRFTIEVLLFSGLLGYLFFMLFFLRYERHRNLKRYERYSNTVRSQDKDMQQLSAIYEKEDQKSHR
jgi:Flp pilus assembly protein TadB